jgi:hypothetical protein
MSAQDLEYPKSSAHWMLQLMSLASSTQAETKVKGVNKSVHAALGVNSWLQARAGYLLHKLCILFASDRENARSGIRFFGTTALRFLHYE